MTGKVASKQDQRRRAIVETARSEFMRRGYAATTMSSIAAILGGSKTTLWSHFRSKDELFAAVIDDLIDRFGEALRLALEPEMDVRIGLKLFGETLIHSICRPEIMALHRMVIAEAGRSSRLGKMVWERGPTLGMKMLAGWLSCQIERGFLRPCDPESAARLFAGLCQAGSYWPHLMGAIPRPSRAQISAEIALAVETFLVGHEQCASRARDGG